jgi:hypothetical protein
MPPQLLPARFGLVCAGAGGTVWLARHTPTQMPIAVKKISVYVPEKRQQLVRLATVGI